MEITTYRMGDFINTKKSNKPAIVIDINIDQVLISIHEYNGDYTFVNTSDISHSNIDNYTKLSILVNFGEWFYNEHKILYQELLINTLINSI